MGSMFEAPLTVLELANDVRLDVSNEEKLRLIRGELRQMINEGVVVTDSPNGTHPNSQTYELV